MLRTARAQRDSSCLLLTHILEKAFFFYYTILADDHKRISVAAFIAVYEYVYNI